MTGVDAGADMVGKTHTDELSRGIFGENAHYGTPINPVPALKKGEPAPPLDGRLKAEFAKTIAPVQTKLETGSPALTAARQ